MHVYSTGPEIKQTPWATSCPPCSFPRITLASYKHNILKMFLIYCNAQFTHSPQLSASLRHVVHRLPTKPPSTRCCYSLYPREPGTGCQSEHLKTVKDRIKPHSIMTSFAILAQSACTYCTVHATRKNHYMNLCGWLCSNEEWKSTTKSTHRPSTHLQQGLTESLCWIKIVLYRKMSFHFLMSFLQSGL